MSESERDLSFEPIWERLRDKAVAKKAAAMLAEGYSPCVRCGAFVPKEALSGQRRCAACYYRRPIVTHCPNGHAYTTADRPPGNRTRCMICYRASQARYTARRRRLRKRTVSK